MTASARRQTDDLGRCDQGTLNSLRNIPVCKAININVAGGTFDIPIRAINYN